MINDGSELFGSATPLAGGGTARDGFAALATLDSNGDGIVNKADSLFSALRVWTDTNGDGISQADELHTLDQLGIAKLNLAATTAGSKNAGNWVGLEGSAQTADGKTVAMADVWFRGAAPAPTPATAAIGTMVDAMRGYDANGQQVGAQLANPLAADDLKLKSLDNPPPLLYSPLK